MRRFKFGLQKLLDVRKQKEEVQRQRLAAAQRKLERGLARLRRLEALREDVVEELRAKCEGELDVASRADHCRYLGTLVRSVRDQQRIVDDLAREEALGRQATIAARRERKVVDKLKERAYAKYRWKAAHLEQAFLDEVGLAQYVREGGENLGAGNAFRRVEGC